MQHSATSAQHLKTRPLRGGSNNGHPLLRGVSQCCALPSPQHSSATNKAFWRNIHQAVHDEPRWLDSVHDFAHWLELDRPMCRRNDDETPSPLWNTADVDAARLQFLLLINADPMLEVAGLSTTEMITYVLHSTFGFHSQRSQSSAASRKAL